MYLSVSKVHCITVRFALLELKLMNRIIRTEQKDDNYVQLTFFLGKENF